MKHQPHRFTYTLRLCAFVSILALTLIVACNDDPNPASPLSMHPSGWMNPDSPDFHGTLVLADGTTGCSRCHGIDSEGGKSGLSCLDCHNPSGQGCAGCHGDVDNFSGAPPFGLHGETSDTSMAVGAHTTHIQGTGLAKAVPCNSCHHVPVYLLDPVHLDLNRPAGEPLDSIAEIVWHGIAGSDATWNRQSRTCTGIYCHGDFPGGNAMNTFVWTSGNRAECGDCHDIGANPAQLLWKHEFHITYAGLSCAECHSTVVNNQLEIIAPVLHVNGVPDTSVQNPGVCDACHGDGAQACTQCHGGTDNQTGAPPVGLHGETSTSTLAVGAHTSHLDGGGFAAPVACNQCHVRPATVLAEGHLGADQIAEITWGTLAGDASEWNRSTATCINTYCHGNFSGGNHTNSPVWTETNQAACGSCHDVGSNPSTLSGRHRYHIENRHMDCLECHVTVVDPRLVIIGQNLHVDGQKTVSFLRGGFYEQGTCRGLFGGACHGARTW